MSSYPSVKLTGADTRGSGCETWTRTCKCSGNETLEWARKGSGMKCAGVDAQEQWECQGHGEQ